MTDITTTSGHAPAGAQDTPRGLSQGRIIGRKFFSHKGAIAGLIVFAAIAVLAFSSVGFGPVPGWWPHDANSSNEIANPGGTPTMTLPTWLGGPGFAVGEFPFGQDERGRDVFARTMQGVQTSLIVMLIIGLVATVLGIAVGAIAGYYGGWVDAALMRTTDLIITFPVIVVGAVLGRLVSGGSALMLALVLGCVSWMGLARLVRGEFIALRDREFIDAARLAGASDLRLIVQQILPNAIGVVVVNVTLLMSVAILLETSLSYLGFGITPPDVSLGGMISEYQAAFSTRPWLFWWPGAFIVAIALAANFIGDGLRDSFDPRQGRPVSAWRRRRARREASSSAPAASKAAPAVAAAPGGDAEQNGADR